VALADVALVLAERHIQLRVQTVLERHVLPEKKFDVTLTLDDLSTDAKAALPDLVP